MAEEIRSCRIVSALSALASKIYRAFAKSIFAKILTSYDALERGFENSVAGSLVSQSRLASSEHAHKTRRRVSALFEQSLFISKIKNFASALLVASSQSYGIFFFAFGICSTVIYLMKKYSLPVNDPSIVDLITGVAVLPAAIILFASKKSLAQIFCDSKILQGIMFDLFGIHPGNIRVLMQEEPTQGASFGLIFGIILGAVSAFVSPLTILTILLAAISIALVLSSPETGLIVICLTLPFASTMLLAYMLILTGISFNIKLLCGKRVFKIELIDVPVMFFVAVILFGGIFSVAQSSLKKMLLMLCFILSYYMVKNLIRSVLLLEKCLRAAAISAFAVSILGIIENFFGSPSSVWLDSSVFSSIDGRVVSTFENPNVLAEFLIIAIPLTVALSFTQDTARKKIFYFAAAIADMICLVFTWSRGAWLGFIISSAISLLIASRAFFTAEIIASPLALLGIYYGKGNVFSRLFSAFTMSDTSSVYRLGIWKGTLRMLGDVSLHGIGIGEQAFAAIYPVYALRGIETAPHSHSLYLQITTEYGIAGLIIFLVLILLTAQLCLSYIVDAESKNNRLIVLSLLSGLAAFLLAGVTDYVWYNYRIFLFFWIILGLTVSSVGTSKMTREEAGKMIY